MTKFMHIAAPAVAFGLLVAGVASAQQATNQMSQGNMTGNTMSHGNMTAAQKKTMPKKSGTMSTSNMTGNSMSSGNMTGNTMSHGNMTSGH